MTREQIIVPPLIKWANIANIYPTYELPFTDIMSDKKEYHDAVDLIRVFGSMHFFSIPPQCFRALLWRFKII
jgi:hypothetical protein